MAKKPKPNPAAPAAQQTPPPEFPVTTPPQVMMDHSFTLQTVMELQKNVGVLTEGIRHLDETLVGQSRTLDRIKTGLAFAGGAFAIISVIFGYVLNHRFEQIMAVLNGPAGTP